MRRRWPTGEAVELLWAVADGVELRARGDGEGGLGLAWQTCDDGVAPA
jgi:hypothetical protein